MVSHRVWNRKGEVMLDLMLDDPEGVLDVVIPPELYRRVRSSIQTDLPLLVTGTMEVDAESGDPLMRAERVERL